MRKIRMVVFVAVVIGMALGGTLIAGADHTTLTSDSNTDERTEKSYHITIGKGESQDGFDANNGGVVRCPGNTEVAKYDASELGDGIYAVGTGFIEISNYDGKSFDWAIFGDSLDVIDANSIIVKGGPASEVYIYPSYNNVNYADHDEGLTAPENPKSGSTYGISHIAFCFDPKA